MLLLDFSKFGVFSADGINGVKILRPLVLGTRENYFRLGPELSKILEGYLTPKCEKGSESN